MKQDWSRKWVASTQARKQRKYRYHAPLHVRHGLLSAHLSKELRLQHGRRSFPLRKGDEIEVMAGRFRGATGAVDRVDLQSTKVYVDGVKVKRTDGREVAVPLHPSNLRITRLNLTDKMRQKAMQRGKRAVAPQAKEKAAAKADEKMKPQRKHPREPQKTGGEQPLPAGPAREAA